MSAQSLRELLSLRRHPGLRYKALSLTLWLEEGKILKFAYCPEAPLVAMVISFLVALLPAAFRLLDPLPPPVLAESSYDS